MIQEKIQTQSRFADFENFENSHLSIQLSLNGLSYCVFDKDLIDVVLLKEYLFDKRSQTPEQLLDYVKEVYETDDVLSQKFESVNVSHKNNLVTTVPDALYDKKNKLDYLKYSVKVLENDDIIVDNVIECDSKNIYIPFENVNVYLTEKYGNFSFRHTSSVLISSLLKYTKHNLNKQFFVNVSKNNIDIIYVDDSRLQLFNSFLFYSKEDFLYYILFAMEQLLLNPDEQKVTFVGDIDINSPLYKITYTYVRNIGFLNVDNYSLSEEFYHMNPHVEKHNFFELLNQF